MVGSCGVEWSWEVEGVEFVGDTWPRQQAAWGDGTNLIRLFKLHKFDLSVVKIKSVLYQQHNK